jgi:hypothetical protein
MGCSMLVCIHVATVAVTTIYGTVTEAYHISVTDLLYALRTDNLSTFFLLTHSLISLTYYLTK